MLVRAVDPLMKDVLPVVDGELEEATAAVETLLAGVDVPGLRGFAGVATTSAETSLEMPLFSVAGLATDDALGPA